MTDNWLHRQLAEVKTRVVAIDPGETTGVCVFTGPNLEDADQIATKDVPVGVRSLREYILRWDPAAVVMEMYRVYSWKSDDHSWAALHTPRLIGGVEYVCMDISKPLTQQTAQMAKGFCTDAKLQEWGLWIEGQKHARDAIRHALYYQLFAVAKIHQR